MIIPAILRSALIIGVVVMAIGCNGSDPEIEKQAASSGFSKQAAAELSAMKLTKDEMSSIAQAKQMGVDDGSLLQIVKLVHDRDLKFDLGETLGGLTQDSLSSTAMIQLVEMGAIPRAEADIRALKESGVGDVALVEIFKMRFVEKKEVLSGSEYAQLKTFKLSDAGLLTFARNHGTPQQLQKLSQELALGKSEPEALKAVGM